jgi:hypothetical protein
MSKWSEEKLKKEKKAEERRCLPSLKPSDGEYFVERNTRRISVNHGTEWVEFKHLVCGEYHGLLAITHHI